MGEYYFGGCGEASRPGVTITERDISSGFEDYRKETARKLEAGTSPVVFRV